MFVKPIPSSALTVPCERSSVEKAVGGMTAEATFAPVKMASGSWCEVDAVGSTSNSTRGSFSFLAAAGTSSCSSSMYGSTSSSFTGAGAALTTSTGSATSALAGRLRLRFFPSAASALDPAAGAMVEENNLREFF